jgi:hypothetical protein
MLALRDRRPVPLQAEDAAAGQRRSDSRVVAEEEEKMIRSLAAATLALSLAACADTARDETDRRALAEARPVGEAIDCVHIARIRDTHIRDDRTIDFYLAGGAVYRNTLPHECTGLHFEDGFSYKTSLSQLCSTDMITVTRPGGMEGPACGLGRFQPIETTQR